MEVETRRGVRVMGGRGEGAWVVVSRVLELLTVTIAQPPYFLFRFMPGLKKSL